MNRRSRTTKPFYQDRFLDIHDLHEIRINIDAKHYSINHYINIHRLDYDISMVVTRSCVTQTI